MKTKCEVMLTVICRRISIKLNFTQIMVLKPKSHKKVSSLLSLCVENLVKNLEILDLESIKILPPHIKNKILRKITIRPHYCGSLGFNTVLELLIYPALKTIDLTFVEIDNGTLKILQECSNLREIYIRHLGNNRITSDGLKNLLENTRNLSLLDVSNCQVFNDDVLELLAIYCTKITAIYADSCDISDVGLLSLSRNLHTLTHLNISNTKVTNLGISSLIQANLTNFRELRLDNCPGVDDDILKMIAENCPNMEILTFFNCPVNGLYTDRFTTMVH